MSQHGYQKNKETIGLLQDFPNILRSKLNERLPIGTGAFCRF